LKYCAAWGLALLLLLAGCTGTSDGSAVTTPTKLADASLVGLDVDNYPVVDGSTSALPLQQTVACHVLGLVCGWQSGFLFNETRSILPDFENPGPQAEVEFLFNLTHAGTHDAYMNLIRGDAELILVARQPSQDELLSARLRGVGLDVRPVALDAFVFLVNVENQIETLTIDQIRQIYTGKLTSWDQLGVDLSVDGVSAIRTYRRDRNSGSQELMESLVMGDENMIDSPDLLLYTMVGPFNAIGGDVLGIGYSVYYFAVYMLPTETVRMLPIEGVFPDSGRIADGSYPFATEVYVVVRQDAPSDSPGIRLRNWLLTPAGQEVVAQSGYVSIIAPEE
jgi:phosphate transport system substrate-binding protein